VRVLEEGMVGASDTISKQDESPVRMTIRDMMNLLYFDAENLEDAKRALEIEALSPGWRGSFEERVAKAN
jgi:MOSC domain-containing protein YiiM